MKTQPDMFEKLEREQKQIAEFQKVAEEEFKHYKALAVELLKLGYQMDVTIENRVAQTYALVDCELPKCIVTACNFESNLLWDLEIVDEQGGSGFYAKKTGKKRMKAPNVNHNFGKSWKQKKDGTFSYDKIAADIAEVIEHRMKQTRLKQNKDHNTKVAVGIAEKLGFKNTDSYWIRHDGIELQPTSNVDKPIKFSFKINRLVTPEEAEEIFNTLKQAGFIS